MHDVLGPVVFDFAIAGYSSLIGRPLQRRRARRLAKKGKIRSVLFAADNARVLPTSLLDGAAEVWEGRIRLWGTDLWIQDVEFPPVSGPRDMSEELGRFRRTDGDLVFSPRTWIYTLRTHQGRVRWAVLDWQADTALTMLGFPHMAPDPP